MPVTKINERGQVTIPARIRTMLHIGSGDLVEVVRDENSIRIVPKQLIDKDQAWFWTEEWQEGEREASEDIREGRISRPFKSVEELDKHLDNIHNK